MISNEIQPATKLQAAAADAPTEYAVACRAMYQSELSLFMLNAVVSLTATHYELDVSQHTHTMEHYHT